MKFSEADLRFLVETVATQRYDNDRIVELVRDKEDFLEQMLEDPALLHRILNDKEVFIRISPYMMFSILLRQIRRELGSRVPGSGVTRVEGLDEERPPRHP